MAYSNAWSNSTPSTSISVAITAAAHDVLLSWMISDTQGTIFTWPSGFTPLASVTNTFDSQTIGVGIKKDASGTEGTLALVADQNVIGGIAAFSGRDNTTQPDVTTVTNNNNSSGASPFTIAGSITPATNGVDFFGLMGSDVDSSVDVVHSMADSGGLTWTIRADQRSGFINGAVGTATQTTAAATTVTGTGTAAGSHAGRSIVIVALRPAAGGGAAVSLVFPPRHFMAAHLVR